MHNRLFLITSILVLTAQLVSAQDLQYRGYVLGSSRDAVLAASDARAADVKIVHERPSMIEELDWRAPYQSSNQILDPVRQIIFSFCDNALYQLRVSYDSSRTEGLSNADIIATLSETYGTPTVRTARSRPLDAAPETVVLAQWDRAGSSLTLLRGVYSAEFQLLLSSKTLSTRARGAIREAERMAIADGPRREQAQRKKDAADAAAAREKLRLANKAAFKP